MADNPPQDNPPQDDSATKNKFLGWLNEWADDREKKAKDNPPNDDDKSDKPFDFFGSLFGR